MDTMVRWQIITALSAILGVLDALMVPSLAVLFVRTILELFITRR